MAKKKRNNRKKHNRNDEAQNNEEFLADLNESNEPQWDQEEDEPMSLANGEDHSEETNQNEPIVDPYSEQLESSQASQEEVSYEEENYEVENELPEEDSEINEEENSQEDSESTIGFSLGAFLQGEREKLGISLKKVSHSTKISLTNLEYLEADDLESLPDRAYVTGYVKSYAKLLGTEVNFCITLLDKTYQAQGAAPKEPEIVIPQAQNSPTISDGFPLAKIGAISAMVIVIVGIAGFFMTRDNTNSSDRKAPQETFAEVEETDKATEEDKEITPQILNAETPLQMELSEQTEEPATEDPSEENEVVAETIQASQEETKPEEEPAQAPEQGKEKETEAEEEEKKTASADKKEEEEEEEDSEKEKRKFYPLAETLYTLDESMSQETINKFLPSQFRVSPVEGIQAVFITAVKGDSWLTYKSDNDPIKKFVLKEGRSLLFRAKEARVFLGNLGAVKIFLNNKPLKVTSRTGVKSLVFPQENAENYVMPLFIYKEDGTVQTSDEWIKENE